MKSKLFVLIFAGVSVLGVRAYAHHSFASTYLEDQKMTDRGGRAAVPIPEPPFVPAVADQGREGQCRSRGPWNGAPAGSWGAKGVQRDTLRPGDHVIVIGSPGRNPEDHRLRMINIKRPSDGWTWKGTFD